MRFFVLSILALLATACAPTESNGPSFPVESDGSIGDGTSRPMLEPMKLDQFKRPWRVLEAPNSCIFIAQGNSDPLFIVASHQDDGAAGTATIKINNKIVYLTDDAGDLGQIKQGGSFRNEKIQITLERNGEETRHQTQNTFFWPAILKISQDEGGSNLYEGHYECAASGSAD